MACGVEFLGEGTEVPRVHDETTDLDGLDVLHLRHFFVLADGGIVHSHFTGVLWLVELDYTGRLLDCHSSHLEFILRVDRILSFSIIYETSGKHGTTSLSSLYGRISAADIHESIRRFT